MDIFEELNEIYNELRAAGIVRTKKELAERLGISDKSIVKAMKGDPQYATASVRTKMIRFRDEALGPKPAPQPAEPTMEQVMMRAMDNMYDAHQIAIRAQDATDRLIALLERQMGVPVVQPREGKKAVRTDE